MRKVFLDELPRKGKLINWKDSVGYKVRFIYDDIKGEFEILDYKSPKLTIKYNNNKYNIRTGDFTNNKISAILKLKTSEFKYNIGDKFDNLILLDKEFRFTYRKNGYKCKWKYYKYNCNICGNCDWILESSLTNGKRCSVCAHQKVLKGYNDIATTDPWMIKYFKNKEDAYKYSHQSTKNVIMICPNCGREKESKISNIYNKYSINCICDDNMSYPEKFIISFLNQLNIKYHKEYLTNWSDNKRYDFYFEYDNKKYIIETHGKQHYESSFSEFKNRSRTLEEEQNNDKYKEQLAICNGIDEYIILDCRKSELDWIKNSIIQSKLNNIFDLCKIDWLKCEEFAINSNLTKEICDYWNQKEEWETTTDLSKNFNLSRRCISYHLKIGMRLGWCKRYDTKEELRKVASKNGKSTSKQVEVFKDDKSLGIFNSASELSRKSETIFGVKLYESAISMVCNKKRNHAKGYKFEYVESEEDKTC